MKVTPGPEEAPMRPFGAWRLFRWPLVVPVLALAILAVSFVFPASTWLLLLSGIALVGAVLAGIHHAEVVAHRIGEPFGTLVLALAVTVIEVGLIVSMMVAGGPGKAELARDTVFAAVMILVNGVVGLSLLVGGLRHREQSFRTEGAGPALAALLALSTLTLVLPGFTTTSPGPTYSTAQLVFAAVASLALWGVFVFSQTIRHRDYFLPPGGLTIEAHAAPPSVAQTWASFALLIAALVAVVGLGKGLSPAIEAQVAAHGAPPAVVGIAISIIVLLPETGAALRAAFANRLQTSMNLALGSGLASIGLTIPGVTVVAVLLGQPLVLGLGTKDLILMALSFAVATITLGTGRTSIMQGAVHLVLFASFLFLAFVP
jgi:Ca2+:H+ antiporter